MTPQRLIKVNRPRSDNQLPPLLSKFNIVRDTANHEVPRDS
jgi:hypothetical protein